MAGSSSSPSRLGPVHDQQPGRFSTRGGSAGALGSSNPAAPSHLRRLRRALRGVWTRQILLRSVPLAGIQPRTCGTEAEQAMILPRPYVTTPHGRRLYGRWIRRMYLTGEGPWIIALACSVRGVCEVTTPVGRADVATDSLIFEVEPARTWRHGAQQAYAYGGSTGLRPAVAIFGEADYEEIYLRVRDRMPGLSLWVWQTGWIEITSRRLAKRKGGTTRPENLLNWPAHLFEEVEVTESPIDAVYSGSGSALGSATTDERERTRYLRR